MAGKASKPGVTVASMLLAVLAAYDGDHRTLTLTELAQRSSLSLATTHRLVAELAGWGALVRRSSGEYVVGRRPWDLGLLAPVQSGLRDVASPFLHDIYAATLATVHLAVRDGAKVLYLDRLSGHQSVPVVSRVGSRLPLHATGVGKVLLAYAPDDVREEVLSHLTLITPYGERVLLEDFEDIVTDLHTLDETARREHPGLPVVLLGHSMGGLIASRYAPSDTATHSMCSSSRAP